MPISSSSSRRSGSARLARFSVLAAWCLCGTAAPAAAEWHITPTIGLTFGGNTTFQDPDVATGQTHPNFGIAVSRLSAGWFGAEAIGSLTPRFFQRDDVSVLDRGGGPLIDASRSTALMGNIVVAAPRRYTEYFLRPFVSGGFGLMRVSARDLPSRNLIDIKANLAGFNIGGGAIGFLTKGVGVRFDLRYFSTLHGTDRPRDAIGEAHLRYMVASAGLVLRR